MNQTLKARQEGFGVLVILFASLLWGTTGTAATYAPDISPLAIGAFFNGRWRRYDGSVCLRYNQKRPTYIGIQ